MTNSTYIVAPRRTLVSGGETLGPGAEIQMTPAEAAHLLAGGFVHRPGEGVTYPQHVAMRPMDGNPAGIGFIGPVR